MKYIKYYRYEHKIRGEEDYFITKSAPDKRCKDGISKERQICIFDIYSEVYIGDNIRLKEDGWGILYNINEITEQEAFLECL